MKDSSSASPSGPDNGSTASTGQSVPKLVITAAESFNYAAWQNSVPLLRIVAIDNTNGDELNSLIVELKASPGFARTKRWTIDRVNAGEVFTLRHVDMDIDPEYLNSLDEAERGVLTFQLIRNGNVLHEENHVLRVLARDEWGGMSTMGELLPAFVTPNDPALATLLKSAANVLGEHGHSTALDGYQSGDPNRAYAWSEINF